MADDNEGVRGVIGAYLKRRGWAVTMANNGKQALDAWAEAGDVIDLVIVDIDISEQTGIDVATTIREANATMPILLMSGSSNLDKMFRGCKAVGWLAKPFGMKTFWDAVNRARGQ